jgi:capsid protein
MAAFDSVEQARVLQFRANVTQLYQQKPSKLRGKTREESIVGKAHFYERLAAEPAVKKTSRHSDTIVLDPIHSRRMVVPVDYVWNALVDQQDKIRLLIDANSEYAIAAANALRRAFDDEVILSFDADAKGGEDGSTTVTFASDWPVTRSGTQGDYAFDGAALTTPNILALKKSLDQNEVDPDNRYIVIPPFGMEQLLKASTAPIASSSDYNTIKALVQGELNTWVGFTWVMSNRLADGSDSTKKKCFAWHRDAMGVVVGKDIMARLSERPDKDYAVQSYACLTMGSTRIQGEGVVRFTIDSDN